MHNLHSSCQCVFLCMLVIQGELRCAIQQRDLYFLIMWENPPRKQSNRQNEKGWTFPQLHGAFQPWQAPGILCSAERTVHLGCDPVYMCVRRDSCPAHLPLLRPASFIINSDDQVAMSLCSCQSMLHCDLWTSIKHSLTHVCRSDTGWSAIQLTCEDYATSKSIAFEKLLQT